jgi:hypothetical protein
MKLTGSAFVLAALLAGAGVSVSANAATTNRLPFNDLHFLTVDGAFQRA